MRVTLGLLTIVAGPVFADPFMISADRVLGVYRAEEYGDNDWNGDGYTDLAVIAISQSGDAVDLYLATSDPETAALRVTDVAYGLLPYDPDRIGQVIYDIGPGHEIYEPLISYSVKDGGSMYVSVNARETGSGVLSVSSYGPRQDDGTATVICEFTFVDIYGLEELPDAVVRGPDGVETRFAPGPEPILAQWRYTDLPSVCLP